MLLVIVITFLVVNKQNKILINIAQLDEKSDEIIYRTQKILINTNDIEYGINDFIFSQNKKSLIIIEKAKKNINEEITILNNLEKDNQVFKSRIDSIEFYFNKQIKFSNQVYFLFARNNFNFKNRLALLIENKSYSDKIHKQIDRIHLEENKFMLQHNK